MRYTIEGFSQEYAMTLRKKVIKRNKEIEIKIDCTDLVILRWFVDFYPNMKKMIVDGREYAWLTHNKLKNDLPLIDISKEAFNERMKKLVEFKVLDYQFVKECGSFSLYTFGENYKYLISKEEGICSNRYGVYVQTDTGVCVQTSTKDTITNNTNTNIDYKYIVDFLNSNANTNYKHTTGKTQSLIRARTNDGYTLDDFKKVILNKCKEWKGTDYEKYLRPETLFGNKFESYLNQNIIKKKPSDVCNFKQREYTPEQMTNLFANLDEVEL